MVRGLDSNSAICAHVWSNLGYLNCLNRFFVLTSVTPLIFSSSEIAYIYLHTCATSSELPTNLMSMILNDISLEVISRIIWNSM